MGGMIIRAAHPDERLALEDLQRRASLVYDAYRPYLLANPDVIELPSRQLADGHVRVAEAGGRVLGFCVVLPRGAGVAELDGLFVEPPHWHRGIGRALVADAAGRLAAGTRLAVTANPRAEGFYARLGFRVTGETATKFGPANRMVLEILGDSVSPPHA